MHVRVERAEPTDVYFDDLSDLLLYIEEGLKWNGELMFDYSVDDDDFGGGRLCYNESVKDGSHSYDAS